MSVFLLFIFEASFWGVQVSMGDEISITPEYLKMLINQRYTSRIGILRYTPED